MKNKNVSIRIKLLATTISVLFLVVAATAAVNITQFKEVCIEALFERARADAQDLREAVQQGLQYFSLDSFSDMTQLLNLHLHKKFSYSYIADNKNIILYHSDGKTKGVKLDPRIYEKLKFSDKVNSVIIPTGKYYECVIPIVSDFDVKGTIHIGIQNKTVDDMALGLIVKNVGILIIALLVAVMCLLYLLTKNFTKPISELAKKVDYINSRFNLQKQVKEAAGDELKEFGVSFELMTKELEEKTVSRDYVKNIIENMNDALFVLSVTGKIITLNRAGKVLLNSTEEKILGRSFGDIVTDGEYIFKEKGIIDFSRSGESRNFETKIKAAGGQLVPVLLSTAEISGEKTSEKNIICAVKDITDIKKAQMLLQRAHDELEKRVEERTAELADANMKLNLDIIQRQRIEKQLRKSYEEMEMTFRGSVQALAKAVESRDPYTAGHQERVAALACAIAREMNLKESTVNEIYMSGVSHDIGKIGIPMEILNKKERLTDEEFAKIKTHPQVGYDILKAIEFPWPLAKIVLQHHERMDGSGYPNGLVNEDILLEAKIIAVADVVEAMAFARPYRGALGVDRALEEIMKNKGKLYDQAVADACEAVIKNKKFEFSIEKTE
ncbi:MAG: HD domain-containing protein [Candidatus Omnitrophica bacterium]|nr:HD domain-containing protein [Candidatus Omnitrophota bacterium]